MVIKIGINGFGRVGRIVFRTCLERSDLEISAINDPAVDVEYICYLVKFDSTHGKLKCDVTHTENEIRINGVPIKVFHQKTPPSIPWQTVGVQYVIEASGMFTSYDKASGHLASANVKRVIVTAPSADVPMVILGVNNFKLREDQQVVSCGSSTLYCLAPIIKVLEDNFGVEDGLVTSIHAMTPSLKPLDGLCLRGKHWRDHRSIHQNIIPASTGACKALGKIIPSVRDKLGGLAFRVPIVNVSVLDLSIRLKRETSLLEIIRLVEQEGKSSLQNIIKISNEEAVSSDFIGDQHSCILDVDSCLELKPDYYKLICWYENEYSYACRVVDLIYFSERQLYICELQTKTTYVRSRLSRKQDSYIQTDGFPRNFSFDFPSKILSSKHYGDEVIKTSIARPIPLKARYRKQTINTDLIHNKTFPRKKIELFKIWNDDFKLDKAKSKDVLLQSCFSFDATKLQLKQVDCASTQGRLQHVQECSKIVGINEDTFKKSYNNILPTENKSETSTTKIDILTHNTKNVQIISIDGSNRSNKKLQTNKKVQRRKLFDTSSDCKDGSQNHCKNNTNGKTNNLSDYVTISNEDTDKKSLKHNDKQDHSISNIHLSNVQNLSYVILTNKEDIKKQSTGSATSVSNDITQKVVLLSKGTDVAIKTKRATDDNIKTDNIIEPGQTILIRNDIANGKLQLINEYRASLVPHRKIKKLSSDAITKKTKDISTNFTKKISKIKVVNETLKHFTINFKEKKDFIPFKSRSQTNITENNPDDLKAVHREIGINEPGDGALYVSTYSCNAQNNAGEFSDNSENTSKMNFFTSNDLSQGDKVTNNLPKESKDVKANKNVNETDSVFRADEVQEYVVDYEIGEHELKHYDNYVSQTVSRCSSPINITTIGQDAYRQKQDIYDKLDSLSGSDSDTSFQVRGRKSQVINIADLTTSLDNLGRLDKICRIIEISDELSDKLLSELDNGEESPLQKAAKKWSFKDFCDKIKLDEFCNKVFGKN